MWNQTVSMVQERRKCRRTVACGVVERGRKHTVTTSSNSRAYGVASSRSSDEDAVKTLMGANKGSTQEATVRK